MALNKLISSKGLLLFTVFVSFISKATNAFTLPTSSTNVAVKKKIGNGSTFMPFIASSVALSARKGKEDLSFIESRDMTREEMLELNAQNEDIMNMELSMMTGFSLIISLPLLYLCWVAFFSE